MTPNLLTEINLDKLMECTPTPEAYQHLISQARLALALQKENERMREALERSKTALEEYNPTSAIRIALAHIDNAIAQKAAP